MEKYITLKENYLGSYFRLYKHAKNMQLRKNLNINWFDQMLSKIVRYRDNLSREMVEMS